ncbi:C4-dicarboxylate ABC transporter substrate-binding protein [Oleiphilus sp. HI0081]|nr:MULTISPECIES: TAXI family TRAP transporter solute-binding subunit [unclassified Oleiphilus]KZY28727.1 C4-dicarboxylate ABC transporter substrate-binding protein [Oleiphilus sp. HI0043]KZY46754.1 C4-dicarboxylate ABC transporter substrate-binding protein [Oleiphilus sp. HI0050]KZY66188.1 C4-dicarboxylate ABC transporter substrate-binding protein [Oleiphilus sp. HI0061]KZY73842.1 C4-dicarboxylate ABC transporter substrate-binding protein [Oleiphilus sp. HI0068]KZY79989.1 C4-dicarboxylate ABC 
MLGRRSKTLSLFGKLKLAKLCIFVFLFGSSELSLARDKHYMIVGTGGVTGVYYPTGGAVCRMINRQRSEHGIRCGVESTQGSLYNLRKVRELDLDMAVVQSDWQYHAVQGSEVFSSEGRDPALRSVFSIYSEPFTVVARKDSGIQTLNDLKGKRINIGNKGSGHRATMEILMQALGWGSSLFSQVSELSSSDQSKALCDKQFDAMIFMAGHPSASIKAATSDCDSILIDVEGSEVNQLVTDNAYYHEVTIPAGMYRGNPNEIKSFGVGATLVSSKDTPDEVIYQLTKSVFENFLEFKKLHPAFHALDKTKMVKEGLSAPLHAGAVRYYKEVGLLN